MSKNGILNAEMDRKLPLEYSEFQTNIPLQHVSVAKLSSKGLRSLDFNDEPQNPLYCSNEVAGNMHKLQSNVLRTRATLFSGNHSRNEDKYGIYQNSYTETQNTIKTHDNLQTLNLKQPNQKRLSSLKQKQKLLQSPNQRPKFGSHRQFNKAHSRNGSWKTNFYMNSTSMQFSTQNQLDNLTNPNMLEKMNYNTVSSQYQLRKIPQIQKQAVQSQEEKAALSHYYQKSNDKYDRIVEQNTLKMPQLVRLPLTVYETSEMGMNEPIRTTVFQTNTPQINIISRQTTSLSKPSLDPFRNYVQLQTDSKTRLPTKHLCSLNQDSIQSNQDSETNQQSLQFNMIRRSISQSGMIPTPKSREVLNSTMTHLQEFISPRNELNSQSKKKNDFIRSEYNQIPKKQIANLSDNIKSAIRPGQSHQKSKTLTKVTHLSKSSEIKISNELLPVLCNQKVSLFDSNFTTSRETTQAEAQPIKRFDEYLFEGQHVEFYKNEQKVDKFLDKIKRQFMDKIAKNQKVKQDELDKVALENQILAEQRQKLLDYLNSPEFAQPTDEEQQRIEEEEQRFKVVQEIKQKAILKKIEEHMKKFRPSKEFIQTLFEEFEINFKKDQEFKESQRIHYAIMAEVGWFDIAAINKYYKLKYTKYRNKFKDYLESLSTIEIFQNKCKYLQFMDKNSIIIQMINNSYKDINFKKQITQSKPETQHFINSIVSTFQLIDLEMEPPSLQQILAKRQNYQDETSNTPGKLHTDINTIMRIKTRTQKNQEKNMKQSAFYSKIKNMVDQQIDVKNHDSKLQSFDVYSIMQMKKQIKQQKDQEDEANGIKQPKQAVIKSTGVNFKTRSIIRFQRCVQRKLLKRPLEFYNAVADQRTDCNLVTKMFIMRNHLKEMFPSASNSENIGEKFNAIDNNIFTNAFYYGILNETVSLYDQQMLKLYFNLFQFPEIKFKIKKRKKKEFKEHDIHQTSYDNTSGNNARKAISVNNVKDMTAALKSTDFGSDMCEINLADDAMCYNNLFMTIVGKQKFYNQIKNFNLSKKDDEDQEKQALMAYRMIHLRNNTVPCPKFVTFMKHVMFLPQQRVSEVEAEALKTYLIQTNEVADCRVYKLCIDACIMTDTSFAQILQGIYEQCISYQGTVQMQYLQTLIYSNNKFGVESYTQLIRLLPHLFELCLNNLTFNAGLIQNKLLDKANMIEGILSAIAQKGTKLMKLKMSQINLSHESIINNLCKVFDNNQNLIHLNLSTASLSAENLNQISYQLQAKCFNMRNLNLSYNLLNFNKESPDFDDSEFFMTNISTFFVNAKFVVDVNLSGMNLQKEQILQTLKLAKNAKYLLSIHLSDNGIICGDKGLATSNEFFYECIEPFDIIEEDLIELGRSMKAGKHNPIKMQKYDILDIDYKKCLNKYFNFEVYRERINAAKNKLCCILDEESASTHVTDTVLRLYKDRILLGKEQKIVEQFKAINDAQVFYGLGRDRDGGFDRFVLTRRLNMPGLVFNQRLRDDFIQSQRFFNSKSTTSWQLSRADECYICEKHQYAVIFYDRHILAQNQGLIEIDDREFVDKLRKDFYGNYSKFMSMTPLICGTVINKHSGQPQFDRKLKMISAPLYTVLQLFQSKEFNFNNEQAGTILETIELFLQSESNHLLRQLNIHKMLKGWQKVLEQKCTENELMDIKNVNLPDFSQDLDMKDYFVFADFLKPGYHQILIYDPKQNRAYCKDFMANLNGREDIYPEFPLQEDLQTKKVVNVWRAWLEDAPDDIIKSIHQEIHESENFLISKYIKCQNDATNCINVLVQYFDVIKIYQKHCLYTSQKYPKIDWTRLWHHIDSINKGSKEIQSENSKIVRSSAELIFIRSTRQENSQGLKSGLQRGELMEFILRSGTQWVSNTYSSKEKVAPHLPEFIKIYFKPYYDSSVILEQRREIRESQEINQFLYDNLEGLKELFEIAKKPPVNAFANAMLAKFALGALKAPKVLRFSFECAKHLFNDLNDEESQMPLIDDFKKIEQCFQFSMMTILDENQNINKYTYLSFVEFLDMLCRIAIICVSSEEPLHQRLQRLLQLLYNKMYKNGSLDEDHFPLIPLAGPNEEKEAHPERR